MALFFTVLKTLDKSFRCQHHHMYPHDQFFLFKRGLVYGIKRDLRPKQLQLHQQHPTHNPPKKRIIQENRITRLLNEKNVEAAVRLIGHWVQSDSKPDISTINSIIYYQNRVSKFPLLADLVSIIETGRIIPNANTHTGLMEAYLLCGKPDTAIEHFKQIHRFSAPWQMTYKRLIHGLVNNSEYERALQVKDEMLQQFPIDPWLYGALMRAYFNRGMDKEAMEYYANMLSYVKDIRYSGPPGIGTLTYNDVLDALNKCGKYDEAIELFNNMSRHPEKTCNNQVFVIMAEGYCSQGRFKEAIQVFSKIGERRWVCYSNIPATKLIEILITSGMVDFKVEEIYLVLIDTCFTEDRPKDAARFFREMLHPSTGLKPTVHSYNKMVEGFIKAGKVDEAKVFFDEMVEKFKLEAVDYQVMLSALCEVEGKPNDILKMVAQILEDDNMGGLSLEMNELVRDVLRKQGREEELVKMLQDKEISKKTST